MRIERYGRLSRQITSSRTTRLKATKRPDASGQFIAVTTVDVSGDSGLDRGTMIGLSVEEREIRALLGEMESKRARLEVAKIQSLEKSCEDQALRLNLIFDLLLEGLSWESRHGYESLSRRDRRVLDLVISLATDKTKVRAARRLLSKAVGGHSQVDAGR